MATFAGLRRSDARAADAARRRRRAGDRGLARAQSGVGRAADRPRPRRRLRDRGRHDVRRGGESPRACTVRTRPVWNHDEPWAEDVAEADAVLYVGVAGSGAIGLWRDLHAPIRRMWLLGSEGVAEAWLAREHGRLRRRAHPLLRRAARAFRLLRRTRRWRSSSTRSRPGGDREAGPSRGTRDEGPRLDARPLLDRRRRPHDHDGVRAAGRRRRRRSSGTSSLARELGGVGPAEAYPAAAGATGPARRRDR